MLVINSNANNYVVYHQIGELIDGETSAHSGGVYSLDFSPDSKELLTASADKTCKIWNVETRQLVT